MAEEHHSSLPPGYEFDGYRIDSILGSGGFGITYRAVETSIGREVAIKEFFPHGTAVRDRDSTTIRPGGSGDETEFTWGLERFLDEARTLARFDHPSIVRVHRFFAANGTAYMVMPLHEGETLAARLARQERLDQAALYTLLPSLLDGLETVHAAGFLHRDIKPANILVPEDRPPVLIDFGAARHAIGGRSHTLTAIVTPGFAPLEQYFGTGNQGPWTDIYALSAVLYRCVTGDKPPDSPARTERDGLVPCAERARGEYAAAFLAAVDRGLAMPAADRPRSIDEWRGLLPGDAVETDSDLVRTGDETEIMPAAEPVSETGPRSATEAPPLPDPTLGPVPEPETEPAAAGLSDPFLRGLFVVAMWLVLFVFIVALWNALSGL